MVGPNISYWEASFIKSILLINTNAGDFINSAKASRKYQLRRDIQQLGSLDQIVKEGFQQWARRSI